MRSKLADKLKLVLLLAALAAPAVAQRNLAGAGETRLALERLTVLGSVLMVAAHPDDENTALLAYFARGRKLRTAYLSLTRGEGGQNLIGPEQGDQLGVIRTEELLAARKIDGAEQFFTRAIDFGYSKSIEETLGKWGRDEVLGDVVWVIRRFRPDVIVLVFSGTARDGHGQHQSSAILAREAFHAAGDSTKFPDQLKWVEPWQPKRVVWNVFYWTREQEAEARKAPSYVVIDTGEFDPVLGLSYAEIAGMSRSMHRSQGFGSEQHRGALRNYLVPVAGGPASKDVFDSVDITWNRLGLSEAGEILEEAARTFEPKQPEKTVPLLLKARPLIAGSTDPLAKRKLAELDETLARLAGLWLDASADRHAAAPGSSLKVDVTVINRSRYPVSLVGVSIKGMPAAGGGEIRTAALPYNEPVQYRFTVDVPAGQAYSQPYWLEHDKAGTLYTIPRRELLGTPEAPPALEARFRLRFDSQEIEIRRPVARRYVDRVEGEQVRPLVIVPPVAVRTSEAVMVFPDNASKEIAAIVRSNVGNAAGEVTLEAPPGWEAEPKSRPFRLTAEGEEAALAFRVTPPAHAARVELRAVATVEGRTISSGTVVLRYPHFPPQTLFPPAREGLVRADIKTLARNVGYVMGAGDDVPQALRRLGCEVTVLSADDLARGNLGQYDAIVTGVRAFNVRSDLRANHQRLMEYVELGGTLAVQYNVLGWGDGPESLGLLGPYPLKTGRARVSVEEAPVTVPNLDHPLLRSPNRITAADFEGWVQERGLYFAAEWDPRYESLFESHDPGEKPQSGGILYTRYGKGAYIFTAYSWFRQLPAGVPGALRIFANLLSAGRAAP